MSIAFAKASQKVHERLTERPGVGRQKSACTYFDMNKAQRDELKALTKNGTYSECLALLTAKRLKETSE